MYVNVNFKTVLTELIDEGRSYKGIADKCNESVRKIQRIHQGKTETVSYDLGVSLIYILTSPMTPPRGESMPQERLYWEARAQRDQELILQQRQELSKLKQTINKLRQKGK